MNDEERIKEIGILVDVLREFGKEKEVEFDIYISVPEKTYFLNVEVVFHNICIFIEDFDELKKTIEEKTPYRIKKICTHDGYVSFMLEKEEASIDE